MNPFAKSLTIRSRKALAEFWKKRGTYCLDPSTRGFTVKTCDGLKVTGGGEWLDHLDGSMIVAIYAPGKAPRKQPWEAEYTSEHLEGACYGPKGLVEEMTSALAPFAADCEVHGAEYAAFDDTRACQEAERGLFLSQSKDLAAWFREDSEREPGEEDESFDFPSFPKKERLYRTPRIVPEEGRKAAKALREEIHELRIQAAEARKDLALVPWQAFLTQKFTQGEAL